MGLVVLLVVVTVFVGLLGLRMDVQLNSGDRPGCRRCGRAFPDGDRGTPPAPGRPPACPDCGEPWPRQWRVSCPDCRYDLIGLPAQDRCPECGRDRPDLVPVRRQSPVWRMNGFIVAMLIVAGVLAVPLAIPSIAWTVWYAMPDFFPGRPFNHFRVVSARVLPAGTVGVVVAAAIIWAAIAFPWQRPARSRDRRSTRSVKGPHVRGRGFGGPRIWIPVVSAAVLALAGLPVGVGLAWLDAVKFHEAAAGHVLLGTTTTAMMIAAAIVTMRPLICRGPIATRGRRTAAWVSNTALRVARPIVGPTKSERRGCVQRQ